MKLSINRNQAGIGLPIILLVVAVLGIAGGAYYFINKEKNGGSVVNQQVADECNRAIDDKDLCRFAASWTDNRGYIATMTTGIDDETMKVVIRNDGNGNTHSTTEMPGLPAAEMIMLNGATYSKATGQNDWLKYPNTDPASADAFTPDFDFEDNTATQNFKKEGKESCGSLTCFKYSYTGEGDTMLLWFDDKDYQLRRMTSSSADGGSMEITYEYTSVTISEPSPVQEFGSQSDSNSADIQRQIEEAMRQYAQ